MPTLASDFFANPTSSLVTVRCWPWQRHGRVCLLGDAAHAIVPFYGQGMNAAFEDCVELARSLREERAQHAALERYEQVRKPSADAIADMALENFTEMRDLAGRADFQYIKRIERTLHAGLGDVALPQYNLVSFSTVPYERAQAQGRRLARVYEQVASRLPADRAAAMTDAAWITEVTSVARPLL
jgi:kynurenine 3-monooxygenase